MTGPRPTNHSALPPRDDREALSALFDGELAPDAVRFAFKRIEHDVEWRDACGRWQLIGDVLRGQAASTAPASFTAGVLQAVAAQAEADAASVSAVASSAAVRRKATARWPWMGGAAVAASVALVTLFVVRPDPETAARSSGAGMVAEAGPAGSPARAVKAGTPDVPGSSPAGATPRTAVATATADRMVRESRQAGPSRPSDPTRPGRPASSNPVESAALPLIAAAPAAPDTAADPFRPAADDIVTRPWPRAVLPGTGSQALTVGFPAAPSPSFYPFEPVSPESAPAPADPQR